MLVKSGSAALDSVQIRPLRPDDAISDLTRLLHRAYKPLADQGLRYLATHQTDEVTSKRVALAECFVATLDDRLCGTILFKRVEHTGGCPWYDRHSVACLAQFAVDPDLQRHGLGRRLIATVEARAIATGAMELALDTAEPATHLVAWYARLGFRHVEYAQWKHTNYRSVVLSKSLLVTPQS